MASFLKAAQAESAMAKLRANDVMLGQLPNLTEQQLQQMGLLVGTANRIHALARQFTAS
jgi:hypothetical protein